MFVTQMQAGTAGTITSEEKAMLNGKITALEKEKEQMIKELAEHKMAQAVSEAKLQVYPYHNHPYTCPIMHYYILTMYLHLPLLLIRLC